MIMRVSTDDVLNRNIKLYVRKNFRFAGVEYKVGEEFPWQHLAISARDVMKIYHTGRLSPEEIKGHYTPTKAVDRFIPETDVDVHPEPIDTEPLRPRKQEIQDASVKRVLKPKLPKIARKKE